MSRRPVGPLASAAIDRRTFLRYGANVAAMATAAGALPSITAVPHASAQPASEVEEATIAELQAAMTAGTMTSRSLTQAYIDRSAAIDHSGPQVNSVIERNRDGLEMGDALDAERAAGTIRGPLHGIPILVKDNIATADGMQTTAGSYALLGSVVPRDAFVVDRLRAAGAVILGKANLSEWANFRGFQSTSGWSGRAGVNVSPYGLNRTACGSSSGSAAAVAASLAAVSLGTETDGSIVCPAGSSSVVGIKPTVGLVSRSGIIPIGHSQDTAGPMARSVEEAPIVLVGLLPIAPPPRPRPRRLGGKIAYRLHAVPRHRGA